FHSQGKVKGGVLEGTKSVGFFESGDGMSLGEFPVRIPQSQDVTANPLRFGSGRKTRNVGT
ncbi:MAG: hypothetical protein VXZ53_09895, partial [Planctomycetota bacterium]|nr:hypothetical protein [Planctomycetota bacterium]